jgi:putative ABC transport system permease protein
VFSFYLRRAVRSLRRTPVLSSVMILDVALGLAVWALAFSSVDAQTRAPHAGAGHVYHVDWGTAPSFDTSGLDNWQRVMSNTPHLLLPYSDALQLSRHPAVARHALTFSSKLVMSGPAGRHCMQTRFATPQLFALFGLRFAEGGPWSDGDERLRAPVIVLDAGSKRALFGAEPALGRSVTIDGRAFRVGGVLAAAPHDLRAFDFSFDTLPAVYLPLPLFPELGARPLYATHGLQRDQTISQLLGSRARFLQLWVELPSNAAREQFESFVLASAKQRGISGAGARSPLLTKAEFAKGSVPISGGFLLFETCAFIALLACCVNLSRLLIVKLEARGPELMLQRALGATRGSVLAQHMLEALLVASLATALGLAIAAAGLVGINAIVPDRPVDFSIDALGVALTCAAGLGAALFAGIFPAIRMCRASPASRLRVQ